jgi:hypothetical protein
MVASKEATHLAETAAAINGCRETAAGGSDVPEKSKHIEKIRLACGIGSDDEEPILQREVD